MPQFFTSIDLTRAADAMLAASGARNTQLLGTMSGIKRRAHTRAIVAFALALDPAPPDRSIATMRTLLGELFKRAVSSATLHAHFATPGRMANDRVDLAALDAWFAEHEARLRREAARLLAEIEKEWTSFTAQAAREAGRARPRKRARDEAERAAAEGQQ